MVAVEAPSVVEDNALQLLPPVWLAPALLEAVETFAVQMSWTLNRDSRNWYLVLSAVKEPQKARRLSTDTEAMHVLAVEKAAVSEEANEEFGRLSKVLTGALLSRH